MRRFAFSLVLFAATCCLAQPPPNDNFTNRTPVFGSAFTIVADTAGATFDYLNEPGYNPSIEPVGSPSHFGAPSLWWSWTPTETSPVVIERTDDYSETMGYLAVYSTTNLSWDSQYDQVSGVQLLFHGQHTVFNAEAGREYQISVASWETGPLHFRFTATNAPVFRVQPKTQTISTGQSVLFTAYALGVKPMLYQWRKDGLDFLNATNYMLAFDNCSLSNAAEYCVVVTSATGVSTSAVARLIVATNDVRPVFTSSLVRATNWDITVDGEVGRKYQIEYSADLQSWSPLWYGVIVNTNTITTFRLARDWPTRFIRLSHYHPISEACNNYMRELNFAKWVFAEENRKDHTGAVWPELLIPYLIDGKILPCPTTGGRYYLSTVIADPWCEYGGLGHLFVER